ncbi:MAG: hypothetical protein ACR2MD_08390 [Aridibacter sp.]
MSKEVINVDGEDREVREDTAKSYRGVMWILGTVLIFIVIAGILLLGFSIFSVSDGELNTPETKTGQQIK